MANQYPYPEFLQETMFEDHGTKVLITDPAADAYLDKARKQKQEEIKAKYPQWAEEFDR